MCESVEKDDLLSDHFDSKQSRGSVDLLVTCHPSRSLITFAFRSSEVKRLLLDLDPYGGTNPLGMFPLFLKRTADVWLHVSVLCFDSFFVWVISLLARDRGMSPQFQKVHRPPLLPITDQFPKHQHCQRCLSNWWRFVSDDLWNTVMCFQPPSLLIGKVWVPVMRFCVCHIHCRVHWRVGRRPGLCRSISALLLIGSTIREFSISSDLWVLEVLCCLY